MKRCLSTGNLSTNDSFVTVANSKKAKRQRQKVQKDQISVNQPITFNGNDSPMSQSQMDTIFSSVINTAGMDINSVINPVTKIHSLSANSRVSNPICVEKGDCHCESNKIES
jgi:hypothetical protein